MAKQSLAAASGAIATPELKLPAMFTAPQEDIKGRFSAPYVCFAHPKRADEWKKFCSQAVVAKYGTPNEGDMYFVEENNVQKLDTLKAGWLCGKQYWVHKKEGSGDIIAASFEERPKPFKEAVEAVILVYFEDRIVAANIQFRTTKCGAAKTMADALKLASTPEWANESAAHKESLIVTQPFGRFFGVLTLQPPRPGKSSGLPYKPLVAEIKPTTLVEWRLFKAFAENPETAKALTDAEGRYKWRLDELQKKLQPASAS